MIVERCTLKIQELEANLKKAICVSEEAEMVIEVN